MPRLFSHAKSPLSPSSARNPPSLPAAGEQRGSQILPPKPGVLMLSGLCHPKEGSGGLGAAVKPQGGSRSSGDGWNFSSQVNGAVLLPAHLLAPQRDGISPMGFFQGHSPSCFAGGAPSPWPPCPCASLFSPRGEGWRKQQRPGCSARGLPPRARLSPD